MWKRLKSPWTIVAVIVLAFVAVIGRSYYRGRVRAALVRELKGHGLWVPWQYAGPPWLERFLPKNTHLFHRPYVYTLELGDDALLAQVVASLPFVNEARSTAPSAVTDATLRRVGQLTWLERLDLSQTQVTDAGLQHIAGLRTLKDLDLSQTQVTDAGVAALRKAIPWADIKVNTRAARGRAK